MMIDKKSIYTEIQATIIFCLGGKSVGPDVNLFSRTVNFMPRDMAYLFLQIRNKYHVNLNEVIDKIGEYTLRNITDAISNSICVGE